MMRRLTAEAAPTCARVVRETDRPPVAANLMIPGLERDVIVDELVRAPRFGTWFTSRVIRPWVTTDERSRHDRHPCHRIAEGRDEAAAAGVDALVVEGVEGAGWFQIGSRRLRRGSASLVADRVDLPIIRGRSVCDARSAAAEVVLGAEG